MAVPPPLQPEYYSRPLGPPPSSGLAVASMVCGIVSVPIFCVWYLSVPLAIVAVTLGLVARGQVRRGVAAGGGMATAGVICGGVTLSLCLVILLAVAGIAIYAATAGSHGHR